MIVELCGDVAREVGVAHKAVSLDAAQLAEAANERTRIQTETAMKIEKAGRFKPAPPSLIRRTG